MEIRTEKELDAAVALARLSKTEELLRQARGHLRPRQAVVQLGVSGLAALVIVRAFMAGHLSFAEVLPWFLLGYAVHLGERINAVVDLLELSQPSKGKGGSGE
jgi:hypothetical protein